MASCVCIPFPARQFRSVSSPLLLEIRLSPTFSRDRKDQRLPGVGLWNPRSLLLSLSRASCQLCFSLLCQNSKSNLRERSFVSWHWGYSSSQQGGPGRKRAMPPRQSWCPLSGNRDECWCSTCFLLFYPAGDPSPWDGDTHIQGGLPYLSQTFLEMSSQTYPKAHLLDNSICHHEEQPLHLHTTCPVQI